MVMHRYIFFICMCVCACVYVCRYVYICMCVCACIYVCRYVYVCIYMQCPIIYIYVCGGYVCICMFTFVCNGYAYADKYVCIYMYYIWVYCMYVCVCVCLYKCIFAHTFMFPPPFYWMNVLQHRPLVTSAPKQLQIIHVLVYMLLVLCHGEDFKSSSKYNTCSIFLN